MKNICFSANTSWYLYNFRRNTILEFKHRGYSVICIAPEDGYSQRLVDELGVIFFHLEIDNAGNNPIKDLKTAWNLFQIYRRLNPVAVFHFTIKNNVYGTIAAKILGIPAINNVSGLGTAFIHSGLVGHIVRWLYRVSQPFAYQVFCQNSEDKELLITHKLIKAEKLRLLPGSGVDLNRFQPVSSAFVAHKFRFLFVGRMLADKGLRELVAAFAMLQERGIAAELKLVGFAGAKNKTAISVAEIESWQNNYGVEWLGSTDTIEELLKTVDCVVLPSYREGLPRSILEACAMALPVIATDVPGCRSVVIHNENGLLCEVKDPEALCQAMEKMICLSDEERKIMGQKGLELVTKHYSKQIVIDAYVGAIERIERTTQPPLLSAS